MGALFLKSSQKNISRLALSEIASVELVISLCSTSNAFIASREKKNRVTRLREVFSRSTLVMKGGSRTNKELLKILRRLTRGAFSKSSLGLAASKVSTVGWWKQMMDSISVTENKTGVATLPDRQDQQFC